MRKLLLAAVLAAFAGQALAQAPLQIPDRERRALPETPRDRPGRRLFISPSGEPFRGPDGLAAWFAQADADHDQAVTAAEFHADALRVFKLYDVNGDGIVDGFEIQAYERERVPELGDVMMAGFGGGEGRRGRRRDLGAEETARLFTPGGQQGAARFSLLNEPEPVLAADADVDGKVSLAEWTRATERRFATLDKQNAGKLTLEALRPQKKK